MFTDHKCAQLEIISISSHVSWQMIAILLAKLRNADNKKAENKLEDKFKAIPIYHVRKVSHLLYCKDENNE